MSDETKIDPKHSTTRLVLRMLGPTIAGLGLLFTVVGFGSFFSSFGTSGPPRYFWCAFVGMPLLFVGGAMCMFAFLGSYARYVFGETAPVHKDTFNYLAEGTQGGVRTVARAVGEGLAEGLHGHGGAGNRCPGCHHDNDSDAKFCKTCGISLIPRA
jgi:hypothetical protein